MLKQLFVAGVTLFVCLVSLLTGSGLDAAFGIYDKTMMLTVLLFLALPFAKTILSGQIYLKDLLLFLGLVAVIGLWPMFQGNGTMGFEYGWLLLVPLVVGQIPFSTQDVRIIGLVSGGFAFVVLASNLFFGVFNGWNSNNIAMTAFLGCAICSAAPWQSSLAKNIHRGFLILMAFWVLRLDSRSCFFGILPLLCLFAFNIVRPAYVLQNRRVRRLLLVTPALIAVVVVVFQNLPLFDVLNELSLEYFGKQIFNGRNELWEEGLIRLVNNPLLGVGRISGGRFHNVAITVLAAYGLIGYYLWLSYFDRIMEDARGCIPDEVLAGCAVSFLAIMLQQSFELGMVSTTANMMSYFLLGVMLGRIRHLKEKEANHERGLYDHHHRSGI